MLGAEHFTLGCTRVGNVKIRLIITHVILKNDQSLLMLLSLAIVQCLCTQSVYVDLGSVINCANLYMDNTLAHTVQRASVAIVKINVLDGTVQFPILCGVSFYYHPTAINLCFHARNLLHGIYRYKYIYINDIARPGPGVCVGMRTIRGSNSIIPISKTNYLLPFD